MNDKSIVVINTPKNCKMCPFKQSPFSFCLGEFEKEKHCPLKPLPQKVEMDLNEYYKGVADGWNDCIDSITGETE